MGDVTSCLLAVCDLHKEHKSPREVSRTTGRDWQFWRTAVLFCSTRAYRASTLSETLPRAQVYIVSPVPVYKLLEQASVLANYYFFVCIHFRTDIPVVSCRK